MSAVTALAPWFGSNRILAENVGKAVAGSSWVGIPFVAEQGVDVNAVFRKGTASKGGLLEEVEA
jgi:hypothetical protein